MVSTNKQRRRLLILGDELGMRRELEKIFSDLEVTASEISDQVPVLVRRIPGSSPRISSRRRCLLVETISVPPCP